MNTSNPLSVDSLDAGLKELDTFALVRAGNAFALLMEDKGLSVVYRTHQPCYGELRPYAKTHPDLFPEHQRKVMKPGDLHSPFPDGTPLAVAVPFHGDFSPVKEEHNTFVEMMIGPLSPWRNAMKDVAVATDKDGWHRGLVFKDTDIEPTVLVSFLMNMKRATYGSAYGMAFARLKELEDVTEHEALVASWFIHISGKTWFTHLYDYHLDRRANMRRLFDGDTVDLTGGTLMERYAYNRPDLSYLFGKDGTSIETLKLGGGPNGFSADRLPEVIAWMRSERDKGSKESEESASTAPAAG